MYLTLSLYRTGTYNGTYSTYIRTVVYTVKGSGAYCACVRVSYSTY